MSQPIILVELNEINFEFIEYYAKRGQLKTFADLIQRHGYVETTSEQEYEQLEPWIQWVTAHTGLTYAEHQVFRLGDITRTEIPQIWEEIEREFGVTVGAVSPINAANRLQNPAFFVPDPWTDTAASGSWALRKLSRAISRAVNDNANAKIDAISAIDLLIGWAVYASLANWPRYGFWAATSMRAKWRKALFLDQLLADLFRREWLAKRPIFSSIFLNGGAHIQHHYMYSSACYSGEYRNPEWYVPPDTDPLLEIYSAYDRVLASFRDLPASPRLIVATGLHQDPHNETTFYWRLKDHADFLNLTRIPHKRVVARMSRDFLIECNDSSEAKIAETALASARTETGDLLFTVDNRGSDLFVMLEYAHDIRQNLKIDINDIQVDNFRDHVAFVALKNGKHNGIGYLLDTQSDCSQLGARMPLSSLPKIIRSAVAASRQSEMPVAL